MTTGSTAATTPSATTTLLGSLGSLLGGSLFLLQLGNLLLDERGAPLLQLDVRKRCLLFFTRLVCCAGSRHLYTH